MKDIFDYIHLMCNNHHFLNVPLLIETKYQDHFKQASKLPKTNKEHMADYLHGNRRFPNTNNF